MSPNPLMTAHSGYFGSEAMAILFINFTDEMGIKPGPPKYKAEVLSIHLSRSVESVMLTAHLSSFPSIIMC
jgi:hypothetical protein